MQVGAPLHILRPANPPGADCWSNDAQMLKANRRFPAYVTASPPSALLDQQPAPGGLAGRNLCSGAPICISHPCIVAPVVDARGGLADLAILADPPVWGLPLTEPQE